MTQKYLNRQSDLRCLDDSNLRYCKYTVKNKKKIQKRSQTNNDTTTVIINKQVNK